MSDASLIPGQSLGGVRLGDTQDDVVRVLGVPNRTHGREGSMFLEYDDMTVALHEGAVNMLIAESPAAGETTQGIQVGSTWTQLVELGDVEFDEEDHLWRSAQQPGVWYQVVRAAHSYEEPLDPPYVTEDYVVSDPEGAFVRRLFIMR